MAVTATEQRPLTIDGLAHETGLTARNIRAYQSKGLLPSPKVRGRTGYYGSEHVARLRLIRDMQAEGFNLTAIKRLLDASKGDGSDALRLQRDLIGAFGHERTEVANVEELERVFGGTLNNRLMKRAEKLGALRPLDEGRYEISNPTLIRAAGELVELGVPITHVVAVGEAVAKQTRAIAVEFVRLFTTDVLGHSGKGGEDWTGAREALDKLAPLAHDVVQASFRQAMASAVEREVERRAKPGKSRSGRKR
jgi:DNA-binding transcriptional MerR regulator